MVTQLCNISLMQMYSRGYNTDRALLLTTSNRLWTLQSTTEDDIVSTIFHLCGEQVCYIKAKLPLFLVVISESRLPD